MGLIYPTFILAIVLMASGPSAIAQNQSQPPARLGPYKIVAVTPPQAINDPAFEALRKQMGPTIEIATAKAGMHLIVRLPAAMADQKIALAAARAGIAVMPLSICYQAKPRRGGLILGNGGSDQAQIREGVQRLARAF